jgi:molybdopterin-guanine dinucleotide biosynthesis protein A
MILGAIIAGGRSTRFGSDKALALIGGERLIDRTALDPQVDRLVVCGRKWPSCLSLADRPQAGLGPLGGLAAALRYARLCGFGKLLSVPVDALAIPHDLVAILTGPGPAVFADQHLVGLWPSALSPLLNAHLGTGQRSVRSWLDVCSARRLVEPCPIGNINRPADLLANGRPRPTIDWSADRLTLA